MFLLGVGGLYFEEGLWWVLIGLRRCVRVIICFCVGVGKFCELGVRGFIYCEGLICVVCIVFLVKGVVWVCGKGWCGLVFGVEGVLLWNIIELLGRMV